MKNWIALSFLSTSISYITKYIIQIIRIIIVSTIYIIIYSINVNRRLHLGFFIMRYKFFFLSSLNYCWHSHKKRKDSLEGSLDRVLFAAELEFPKIIVPRLAQHISDVNSEWAGKSVWSKQLYYLYVTSFLEH